METRTAESKYHFKRAASVVPPPAMDPLPAPTPVTPPPSAPAKDAKAELVHPAPSISGTALAALPPPTPAPYERRKAAKYTDDCEELSTGDIITPHLNIVHKTGELSNEFGDGDLLLNGELVLLPSPKGDKTGRCIKIIVAGFRKDRYAEKTEGGKKGNLVNTEEEVFKLNATTDYSEAKATGKKLYQSLATCLILIEKPDWIEDPSFKYFINGKAYTPALWNQKGTAYTHATKYIRTARKVGWLSDEYNPDGTFKIKRSYGHGCWELRTELKDFYGNFTWVPALRRSGYTTPEMQAFAASILG